MNYYFAPMEGVTSHWYRNAHQRYFGGVDKYFCPFLSPGKDRKFSKKELRDVLPENNVGTHIVPQLLTRNPEHFLWAAQLLAELGYDEVNFNLGCPSGTVVAKGKGSGFLIYPDELERFLDAVFVRSPLPISIKTRLGKHDPEEFPHLLELFGRYPMTEFIVHPRIQQDYYRAPARHAPFQQAVEGTTVPLCYNGDIRRVADCQMVEEKFPTVSSMMLGRGLIANPALARQAQGGTNPTAEEFVPFLEEIFEGYAEAFESRRNAMLRMKELWSYQGALFENSEKLVKKLRKTNVPEEYEDIVRQILSTCPIRTHLDVEEYSDFDV